MVTNLSPSYMAVWMGRPYWSFPVRSVYHHVPPITSVCSNTVTLKPCCNAYLAATKPHWPAPITAIFRIDDILLFRFNQLQIVEQNWKLKFVTKFRALFRWICELIRRKFEEQVCCHRKFVGFYTIELVDFNFSYPICGPWIFFIYLFIWTVYVRKPNWIDCYSFNYVYDVV